MLQFNYNIKDIEFGVSYSSATFASDGISPVYNDIVTQGHEIETAIADNLERQHLDLSLGYLINRQTGMKLSLDYTRRSSITSLNIPETNWFSVTLKTQLRNLYNDF